MTLETNGKLKRVQLLASSFSGSTLFGIMLCQDPRFIGLGDTYLIPGISDETSCCNCGDTVLQCDLRVKLSHMLAESGLPTGMVLNSRYRIPYEIVSSRYGGTRVAPAYQKAGRWLGYRRVYSTFIKRENGFINSLGAVGNYRYFLDGTKSLVRADIFSAIDEETTLIHLVRNPYAVLHSGVTRHDDRGRSITTHLQGWIMYNTLARDLCNQHRDRSAVVLFSDLVNNPVEVMQRLAVRFGWNTVSFEPEKLDPKKTHIIGNRSRHQASKVRANQLQPDENQLLQLGVSQEQLDKVSETYQALSECVW